METTCRHATLEEADAIVQISVRVQDVFTASGSLQVIGPLEINKVKQAISRRHCFVLEGTGTDGSSTQLIGCAVFRPLEGDHFACTSDFDITRFASPWFFMGSVMLQPEYQGHGLGASLVAKSIELLQQDESTGTIFLDCWAGSDKLRDFYSKLGFMFAAEVPQEDYEIAIFYWLLNGTSKGGVRQLPKSSSVVA